MLGRFLDIEQTANEACLVEEVPLLCASRNRGAQQGRNSVAFIVIEKSNDVKKRVVCSSATKRRMRTEEN